MHLTNQASMFFPMPEDQIARYAVTVGRHVSVCVCVCVILVPSIVKQSTQELEKEDSDPIDYADFEYSLLRFDDFMHMATDMMGW